MNHCWILITLTACLFMLGKAQQDLSGDKSTYNGPSHHYLPSKIDNEVPLYLALNSAENNGIYAENQRDVYEDLKSVRTPIVQYLVPLKDTQKPYELEVTTLAALTPYPHISNKYLPAVTEAPLRSSSPSYYFGNYPNNRPWQPIKEEPAIRTEKTQTKSYPKSLNEGYRYNESASKPQTPNSLNSVNYNKLRLSFNTSGHDPQPTEENKIAAREKTEIQTNQGYVYGLHDKFSKHKTFPKTKLSLLPTVPSSYGYYRPRQEGNEKQVVKEGKASEIFENGKQQMEFQAGPYNYPHKNENRPYENNDHQYLMQMESTNYENSQRKPEELKTPTGLKQLHVVNENRGNDKNHKSPRNYPDYNGNLYSHLVTEERHRLLSEPENIPHYWGNFGANVAKHQQKYVKDLKTAKQDSYELKKELGRFQNKQQFETSFRIYKSENRELNPPEVEGSNRAVKEHLWREVNPILKNSDGRFQAHIFPIKSIAHSSSSYDSHRLCVHSSTFDFKPKYFYRSVKENQSPHLYQKQIQQIKPESLNFSPNKSISLQTITDKSNPKASLDRASKKPKSLQTKIFFNSPQTYGIDFLSGQQISSMAGTSEIAEFFRSKESEPLETTNSFKGPHIYETNFSNGAADQSQSLQTIKSYGGPQRYEINSPLFSQNQQQINNRNSPSPHLVQTNVPHSQKFPGIFSGDSNERNSQQHLSASPTSLKLNQNQEKLFSDSLAITTPTLGLLPPLIGVEEAQSQYSSDNAEFPSSVDVDKQNSFNYQPSKNSVNLNSLYPNSNSEPLSNLGGTKDHEQLNSFRTSQLNYHAQEITSASKTADSTSMQRAVENPSYFIEYLPSFLQNSRPEIPKEHQKSASQKSLAAKQLQQPDSAESQEQSQLFQQQQFFLVKSATTPSVAGRISAGNFFDKADGLSHTASSGNNNNGYLDVLGSTNSKNQDFSQKYLNSYTTNSHKTQISDTITKLSDTTTIPYTLNRPLSVKDTPFHLNATPNKSSKLQEILERQPHLIYDGPSHKPLPDFLPPNLEVQPPHLWKKK